VAKNTVKRRPVRAKTRVLVKGVGAAGRPGGVTG